MLTDQQRAEARRWLFARIDRLMAPGVGIYPRTRGALVQKREAYATHERRVPTAPERNWILRLLVQVGLERRTCGRTPASANRPADHHPEASAPSALQGSRKPTAMQPWLASTSGSAAGRGLPLRPPMRRAVSP